MSNPIVNETILNINNIENDIESQRIIIETTEKRFTSLHKHIIDNKNRYICGYSIGFLISSVILTAIII